MCISKVPDCVGVFELLVLVLLNWPRMVLLDFVNTVLVVSENKHYSLFCQSFHFFSVLLRNDTFEILLAQLILEIVFIPTILRRPSEFSSLRIFTKA